MQAIGWISFPLVHLLNLTVQNLLSELFTKCRNDNSVWSFSLESEVGVVVQLGMRNITQQIIRSDANAVTVSLHLKWS